MDQKTLLDMLARLDGRIRVLQQERNEAVARASALEREVSEMTRLVGMVRTAVEKMLKGGAEEAGVPPGAPPADSGEPDQFDEFSPDPDRMR